MPIVQSRQQKTIPVGQTAQFCLCLYQNDTPFFIASYQSVVAQFKSSRHTATFSTADSDLIVEEIVHVASNRPQTRLKFVPVANDFCVPGRYLLTVTVTDSTGQVFKVPSIDDNAELFVR